MRKRLVSVIFLLCPFLLSGCWDNIDIGKQNYAMLIALDGSFGDIRGIIQCSDPTSPEASEDNTELLQIKGSGVNISSCIGNAEAESDKLVTYEHLQLIVLSPEFYKSNTLECIQYFMADAEMQKSADVIITDSEASEMISNPINNKPFFKHVCGILSSDTITASTVLLDSALISVSRLQKDGHPFRITRIGYNTDSKEVFSDGFGVFSSSGFHGYVGRDSAELIRWFGMKSGNFYVSCLMEGEENPVGFRCVSSKSRLLAKRVGNGFRLKVKIDADFRLNEYSQKPASKPFDAEFYNRAENAVSAAVFEQCAALTDIAQKEVKCDFLGFSRAAENEYPDWWEENHGSWNEFFINAEIDYEINCSLITTGDLK